jgi:DNA polymerase III delta prime subunit
MIFQGETGTGKTSAALALAAELGCDTDADPPEFGGLHIIASGKQSADAVRELCDRRLWTRPFGGSGWKVVIVNEADRMSPAVETIWLDRLESLPPRTVVVFTTNYPDKLSRRFGDRCTRLDFQSAAKRLKLDAYGLLAGIWRAQRPDDPDMTVIARIVDSACEDGRLSFRRAVQGLHQHLIAAKGQRP